jgi:hypothetical protein
MISFFHISGVTHFFEFCNWLLSLEKKLDGYFQVILPINNSDMDKVKKGGMFQLWCVLLTVLVVSVFAGVAMQISTIVSSNSRASLIHPGPSIGNAVSSILPGFNTKGIAGHRARVSGYDGIVRLDKEVISHLKDQYGKALNNPKVQVQAIEEIQQLLVTQYPENFQEKIGEAVKLVFPDNVEQLMKMSSKVARYDTWLNGVWATLLTKGAQERQGIIRGKRSEIFGPEADKIWPDNVKAETINKVLKGLNRVKGASLIQKLAFLHDTIHQEYASDADAYIKDHQQDLLDRFFKLESVQSDLKGMQPQVRRQNLRAIRQAFGMDNSTLAHWDTLEKARDERWEKGVLYMKDRQQVIDSVPGELREIVLNELRQKYFGSEAATVAGEEKTGYFRFKVMRLYGLR